MVLVFDSITKKMTVNRGNDNLTDFLNEVISVLAGIKEGEYSLDVNYLDSDVFEKENLESSSNTMNAPIGKFKIG